MWVTNSSQQLAACQQVVNASSVGVSLTTRSNTTTQRRQNFQCAMPGGGLYSTSTYLQATFTTSCANLSTDEWPLNRNGADYMCLGGCGAYVVTSTNGLLADTDGTVCSPIISVSQCPLGMSYDGSGGCILPPPDTDNDGTPDHEDAFPSDPSEHADADGDGVGDNADVFDSDPNETIDTDGDGEGDNADPNDEDADNGQDDGVGNESDNTSTGGGDCNNRPVSSGDAILSQIALQTWETRCALEEGNAGVVTGDPTNCNGIYTCSGDQIQCAQVAVMRKAACENLNIGIVVPGDGDDNNQPDWTQVSDPGINGDGDEDPSDYNRNVTLSASMIDTAGFGGSRSCPVLPDIVIPGWTTISFGSLPYWCQLIQIMSVLTPLMGAWLSAKILSGAK